MQVPTSPRQRPPVAGAVTPALPDAADAMTIPEIEDRQLAGRIARQAARARVNVDIALLPALASYVALLMRWNRRINLTALTDDERGIDRLVIEPLIAAQRLPKNGASITDIGSGGGSPAIPLKLAAPTVTLRMVESRTRKAAFLREVVRQLRLKETVVEACRYQELVTRGDQLERADIVTVRAVSIGRRMLQQIQPLVRAGGAVFLFRRSDHEDVSAEVPPPLRLEATYPLLDSADSRLVVLRKPGLDRPSA